MWAENKLLGDANSSPEPCVILGLPDLFLLEFPQVSERLLVIETTH